MSYSSCTFANNALPIFHAQRHNHPPQSQSYVFPPFAHHPPLLSSSQSHRIPSCSRLQEMPLASESPNQQQQPSSYYENDEEEEEKEEEEEEEEVGISKIQVPRQKHISVSKSQLLDAILSTMFNQDKDAAHYFRLLTSCLDSILHAEHKSILEEMRSDYHLTNPLQTPNPDTQVVANGNDSSFASSNGLLHTGEDSKQDMQLPDHGFNLTSFLRSLDITGKNNNDRGSRFLQTYLFLITIHHILSPSSCTHYNFESNCNYVSNNSFASL